MLIPSCFYGLIKDVKRETAKVARRLLAGKTLEEAVAAYPLLDTADYPSAVYYIDLSVQPLCVPEGFHFPYLVWNVSKILSKKFGDDYEERKIMFVQHVFPKLLERDWSLLCLDGQPMNWDNAPGPTTGYDSRTLWLPYIRGVRRHWESLSELKRVDWYDWYDYNGRGASFWEQSRSLHYLLGNLGVSLDMLNNALPENNLDRVLEDYRILDADVTQLPWTRIGVGEESQSPSVSDTTMDGERARRDRNKSLEYFTKVYKYDTYMYENSVQRLENIIEEKGAVFENMPFCYSCIAYGRFLRFHTGYSMGMSREELLADAEGYVESIGRGWNGRDFEALVFACSFAILFNIRNEYTAMLPQKALQRLNKAMYGEKFLKLLEPDWEVRADKTCCRDDHAIVEVIDLAQTDKEAAAARLKKFLEKEWFKTLKDGLIKNTDLEEGTYRGYWCIEAAALVKALALDDTTLRDCAYYPYDLAHFYG